MAELYYSEDEAYDVQVDDIVMADIDQKPRSIRYSEFDGCAEGTITKVHAKLSEATVRYAHAFYRTTGKPKFKSIRLPISRITFVERAR